jgi:N6-adenosine-specific RNA methylase IME4
MSDDDIARLKIRELGADDSVCLLWTAGHLLGKSKAWLEGWGFTFKTELVWRKVTRNHRVRIGCGFLARSAHESVLVGTAGRPRRFTYPSSIFDGVAREHSRKPDEFYRITEQVFAGRRLADIFARERRPGWSCWGDELDRFNPEHSHGSTGSNRDEAEISTASSAPRPG